MFDVLVHRGRPLFRLPVSLEQRRDVLEDNIFNGIAPGAIALSETIRGEPADLIRIVREFGFEGIIAKRKDSCYESGRRTGAWSKYKVNKGQEFVIGGYTPRNPFDSIIVGYYEDGKLIFAEKVRNGFVPPLRREVAGRFKGLEIDYCPFANLPEKKRNPWGADERVRMAPARARRANRVHRMDARWSSPAFAICRRER